MSAKLKDEPASQDRRALEEILLQTAGVRLQDIVGAKLKAASKRTTLARVLLNENLVSEIELVTALSEESGLTIVDLKAIQPDVQALKILDEKLSRKFNLFPLVLAEDVLTVCIFDPADRPTLQQLSDVLKIKLEYVLSLPSQITHAIEIYYKGNPPVESEDDAFDQTPTPTPTPTPTGLRITLQDSKSKNVEDLINQFIDSAVSHRASDVHVEPDQDVLRIRLRIDGVLHEITTFPPDIQNQILSRLKVIAGLDIAEKRNAQDGSFQHKTKNGVIDCRLSTLPTIKGEKAVIRILDKSVLRVKLDELGMRQVVYSNMLNILEAPHGLILVTGPTGSGKTTTVYSMLNQISSMEKNVITIEDPVELQFPLVNQVQVNAKAGLTFPTILRNILRQDPDIIMIGEIRDKETADLAIRAALTGHLVISTIHTNDSANTVTRLIDMGIEPFMVASALVGVVSQRLVRNLCPDCKKPRTISADELKTFMPIEHLSGSITIYEPAGCPKCYGYGYRGRHPIFELLVPNHHLRRAISANKSPDELQAILTKSGFESMRVDGIQKVLAGKTSLEEVLKATI